MLIYIIYFAGTCAVQVVDKANGKFQQLHAAVLNDSSSRLAENSHLGPVPRVKTKSKANSSAIKRQFSLNSDAHRSQSSSASRKRRHSSDSLKAAALDKDTNLIDSNSGDNNNVYDSNMDLARTMNEIGLLNCIDVESLEPSLPPGTLLCTDMNQTGGSNLTISGGSITANLNSNMNLHSSLTLCQTMGLNPGIAQNLVQNPGLSQTQLIVDQGQVVNHVVAPNVAVTQGMMVSLPNVTQMHSSGYQAHLKEILPAPSLGKQANSSTGVYITTQVHIALVFVYH